MLTRKPPSSPAQPPQGMDLCGAPWLGPSGRIRKTPIVSLEQTVACVHWTAICAETCHMPDRCHWAIFAPMLCHKGRARCLVDVGTARRRVHQRDRTQKGKEGQGGNVREHCKPPRSQETKLTTTGARVCRQCGCKGFNCCRQQLLINAQQHVHVFVANTHEQWGNTSETQTHPVTPLPVTAQSSRGAFASARSSCKAGAVGEPQTRPPQAPQ